MYTRLLRLALLCMGLALVSVSLFALFQGADLAQTDPADTPVTVVFRYDDLSATSLQEVDEGLLEAFASRGLQLTVGVIPLDGQFTPPGEELPLTPEKIELLNRGVSSGAFEVALHGLTHRNGAPGQEGEFGGLSLDEQRARLDKGLALLAEAVDVPVTTFIPPWNRHDRATLKTLAERGFTCISAGPRGPTTTDSRLRFLPWTVELPDVIRGVEHARRGPGGHSVVVLMFHPYDFTETGDDRAVTSLAEFNALLDELATMEGVRLLSVAQAMEAGVVWSAQDYRRHRTLSRLAKLLPRGFVPDQTLLYLDGRSQPLVSLLARGAALKILAGVGAAFACMGWLAGRPSVPPRLTGMALAALVLLPVGYALRQSMGADSPSAWKFMLAATLAGGTLWGLLTMWVVAGTSLAPHRKTCRRGLGGQPKQENA